MSPGNYESTIGSSPYNVMSPWNQSSPMNKSPWLTSSPFANFFEGLPRINGLIGSLVQEEGHIYSLAVSADLLYTGSDSKNIRVWKNIKEFSGFNSNSGLVKAIVICGDRDYFRPIECIPFHEIVCFKSVEKLQSALIGDPRRRIQVDLLEFYKILRCSCCSRSGNILVPSMHDTSVLYTLAQEHGDLINLHDWFQSFKTIVLRPSKKGKPKSKQSPLPKKRKDMNESENKSEASIQARFCRAVTELQITGLLRMPSRRRPDCVQRVAFGL